MCLAHRQACTGWKFYDENRIFVPWVLAILLLWTAVHYLISYSFSARVYVFLCGYVHGSKCMSSVRCLRWCVRIHVSLGCMKLRRPARVCTGWGRLCSEKWTEASLGLSLFTAAGHSARHWGKVGVWEQRKCIHHWRCWEVKTSAVGCPSKALFTTGRNNRAGRELVDSLECPSPCYVASRGRAVCSEGREGERHGRLSRDCLPCQGLLSLLDRGWGLYCHNCSGRGGGTSAKQWRPTQTPVESKARLYQLVSLASVVSNRARCAVWPFVYRVVFGQLFFFFTSLKSLSLAPALLQYRHLSPTWLSQRSLPLSPPFPPPSVVPWHPSV